MSLDMKFIPLKQGTEEWLRFRRSHIGASDAVTIMGVSPWKSPLELYEEKIFEFEQQGNAYTARGVSLEEPARESFEKEKGICVFPMVFESSTHPFMAASIDGITIDYQIAVEIKCPGKVDHQKAMHGVVPTKYYPQLQHQIFVCELDMIYYYSFDGQQGVTLEVPRDDRYIEILLDKEKEFWHCLKTLKPP
jgi:putative phage-type endonuclease